MTPETPTPETDADYKEAQDFERSALVEPLEKFLKVERERDAARAENEAMREAIQEGHDALDTCIEFIKDAHIIEAQWDWEPVKKANATLAKLKPFIPDASPPKP